MAASLCSSAVESAVRRGAGPNPAAGARLIIKNMDKVNEIFEKVLHLTNEMASVGALRFSEGNMPICGRDDINTAQFQVLPKTCISQRSDKHMNEFHPESPSDTHLLHSILSKIQDKDQGIPDQSTAEQNRLRAQSLETYISRLAFEDGEEIGLVLYRIRNDSPCRSK